MRSGVIRLWLVLILILLRQWKSLMIYTSMETSIHVVVVLYAHYYSRMTHDKVICNIWRIPVFRSSYNTCCSCMYYIHMTTRYMYRNMQVIDWHNTVHPPPTPSALTPKPPTLHNPHPHCWSSIVTDVAIRCTASEEVMLWWPRTTSQRARVPVMTRGSRPQGQALCLCSIYTPSSDYILLLI